MTFPYFCTTQQASFAVFWLQSSRHV